MARKITTEIFVSEMKDKYGDRFIYEKVVYVDAKTKIIVTCPKHGDFEILPSNFRAGYGCAKCTTQKIVDELHLKLKPKIEAILIIFTLTIMNLMF